MHWLPPNGALHGVALDHLLGRYLSIMFWLFLAAQVLILAAMFRRRSNPGAARRGQSTRVFLAAELLPLLAISGLFAWMIFTSHHLWAARREVAAEAQALPVEVTGVQFQWYFRYPGADGIFGRVDPQKFSKPEEGNGLGIDPNDPAGRDDVVSTSLMLPVNRDIELDLRGQDVIHSLFIPAMRIKQDTVPGMTIETRLHPTQLGNFEIACAELCGTGHYRMRALARVVTEQQFAAWLKAREAQQ